LSGFFGFDAARSNKNASKLDANDDALSFRRRRIARPRRAATSNTAMNHQRGPGVIGMLQAVGRSDYAFGWTKLALHRDCPCTSVHFKKVGVSLCTRWRKLFALYGH